MALLGFTSFYREGLEVVLFLQSYRLKLGNATVLYGVVLGRARFRSCSDFYIRGSSSFAVPKDADPPTRRTLPRTHHRPKRRARRRPETPDTLSD